MTYLRISLCVCCFSTICCLALYIPSVFCSPGKSGLNAIATGMARLGLGSKTKIQNRNSGQAVKPFMLVRDLHSKVAARLLQTGSRASADQSSTNRFNPLHRFARSGSKWFPSGSRVFNRAIGISSLVLTGFVAANYMRNRLNNADASGGANSETATSALKKIEPVTVCTSLPDIVPGAFSRALSKDMQDWDYRAGQFHDGSKPGISQANTSIPMHGEWRYRRAIGKPAEYLSVRCDKKGCSFWAKDGAVDIKIGKVYFTPGDEGYATHRYSRKSSSFGKEAWGVKSEFGIGTNSEDCDTNRTGLLYTSALASVRSPAAGADEKHLHLRYYDKHGREAGVAVLTPAE